MDNYSKAKNLEYYVWAQNNERRCIERNISIQKNGVFAGWRAIRKFNKINAYDRLFINNEEALYDYVINVKNIFQFFSNSYYLIEGVGVRYLDDWSPSKRSGNSSK